jgi:hypothetical protein
MGTNKDEVQAQHLVIRPEVRQAKVKGHPRAA